MSTWLNVLSSAAGLAKAAFAVVANPATAATPLPEIPEKTGSVVVHGGLTFDRGIALAFDRLTGKWPTDSVHRREIAREVTKAAELLATLNPPVTEWEAVRKPHLRALWRARIGELRAGDHEGIRGAIVTVSRFLAVARWLRDEGHIVHHDACVAPSNWKRELTGDWIQLTGANEEPTPRRLRHTLEEMREILRVSRQMDPRFALLLAIGAEQRLGQVLRVRRSNIDLAKRTVRIPSRGKKKGALLELTPGQIAAVEIALLGYAAPWEATQTDYLMFPGGRLRNGQLHHGLIKRGPMQKRSLHRLFLEAEEAAGVPHVEGRAWYGLRRVAVDAALDENISTGGLEAHGGWTTPDMAMRVYRDKDRAKNRIEARDVRARIRGESSLTLVLSGLGDVQPGDIETKARELFGDVEWTPIGEAA